MDAGDGVSHTTEPICEGYTLLHAVLCLAGRDFAEYSMKNVFEREYSFTAAVERGFVRDVKEKLRHIGVDYDTEFKSAAEIDKERTHELPDGNIIEQGYSLIAAAEREIARDAKEKPCYVCFDLDTEHKSTAEMDKEKTYEFPDRNIISVSAERIHCVDILFQPSFIGKETSGFHHTSFKCNTKWDADIRKKTYELPDKNIITVGAKRFRCVEVLFQPV